MDKELQELLDDMKPSATQTEQPMNAQISVENSIGKINESNSKGTSNSDSNEQYSIFLKIRKNLNELIDSKNSSYGITSNEGNKNSNENQSKNNLLAHIKKIDNISGNRTMASSKSFILNKSSSLLDKTIQAIKYSCSDNNVHRWNNKFKMLSLGKTKPKLDNQGEKLNSNNNEIAGIHKFHDNSSSLKVSISDYFRGSVATINKKLNNATTSAIQKSMISKINKDFSIENISSITSNNRSNSIIEKKEIPIKSPIKKIKKRSRSCDLALIKTHLKCYLEVANCNKYNYSSLHHDTNIYKKILGIKKNNSFDYSSSQKEKSFQKNSFETLSKNQIKEYFKNNKSTNFLELYPMDSIQQKTNIGIYQEVREEINASDIYSGSKNFSSGNNNDISNTSLKKETDLLQRGNFLREVIPEERLKSKKTKKIKPGSKKRRNFPNLSKNNHFKEENNSYDNNDYFRDIKNKPKEKTLYNNEKNSDVKKNNSNLKIYKKTETTNKHQIAHKNIRTYQEKETNLGGSGGSSGNKSAIGDFLNSDFKDGSNSNKDNSNKENSNKENSNNENENSNKEKKEIPKKEVGSTDGQIYSTRNEDLKKLIKNEVNKKNVTNLKILKTAKIEEPSCSKIEKNSTFNGLVIETNKNLSLSVNKNQNLSEKNHSSILAISQTSIDFFSKGGSNELSFKKTRYDDNTLVKNGFCLEIISFNNFPKNFNYSTEITNNNFTLETANSSFPQNFPFKVADKDRKLLEALDEAKKIDIKFYNKYIQNNLEKIITTQTGSYSFQINFEKFDKACISMIIKEITPKYLMLINNSYANYFCQIIFNHFNDLLKFSITKQLINNIKYVFDNPIAFNTFKYLITYDFPDSCQIELVKFFLQFLNYDMNIPLSTYISKLEYPILPLMMDAKVKKELFYDSKTLRIFESMLCFKEEYIDFIIRLILTEFEELLSIRQGYFLIRNLIKENKNQDVQKRIIQVISSNTFNFVNTMNGLLICKCIIRNFSIEENQQKKNETKKFDFIKKNIKNNKLFHENDGENEEEDEDKSETIIYNYNNPALNFFYNILLDDLLNYRALNKQAEKLLKYAIKFGGPNFTQVFLQKIRIFNTNLIESSSNNILMFLIQSDIGTSILIAILNNLSHDNDSKAILVNNIKYCLQSQFSNLLYTNSNSTNGFNIKKKINDWNYFLYNLENNINTNSTRKPKNSKTDFTDITKEFTTTGSDFNLNFINNNNNIKFFDNNLNVINFTNTSNNNTNPLLENTSSFNKKYINSNINNNNLGNDGGSIFEQMRNNHNDNNLQLIQALQYQNSVLKNQLKMQNKNQQEQHNFSFNNNSNMNNISKSTTSNLENFQNFSNFNNMNNMIQNPYMQKYLMEKENSLMESDSSIQNKDIYYTNSNQINSNFNGYKKNANQSHPHKKTKADFSYTGGTQIFYKKK